MRIGCVLLLSVSLLGCGSGDLSNEDGKTSVQVALNWYPEAQHAGFYAAEYHGLYEKAGLKVEILKGGPNAPVIPNVASGKVAFGLANADDVLLAREQEADVVTIAALLQENPRCLVVRADSRIQSFADLQDCTLAMGIGRPYRAFLEKQLPLENVKIERYFGRIDGLLKSEPFAQQGYVFSEPITAKLQDIETRVLMVSELGFNPYANVIVTNSTMISEKPEIVEKFLTATREGWLKYFEDPTPIHKLLQAQNQEKTIQELDASVAPLKKLMFEGITQKQLGSMEPQRWKDLATQLADLFPDRAEKLSAEGSFTNQFLTE